jgi:hypothetical protein
VITTYENSARQQQRIWVEFSRLPEELSQASFVPELKSDPIVVEGELIAKLIDSIGDLSFSQCRQYRPHKPF